MIGDFASGMFTGGAATIAAVIIVLAWVALGYEWPSPSAERRPGPDGDKRSGKPRVIARTEEKEAEIEFARDVERATRGLPE